jgi:hypothetical protein
MGPYRPRPHLLNVLCSKALVLACSLTSTTTTTASTTLTATLHDGVRTQPQKLLDVGSVILWVVAWTHDRTHGSTVTVSVAPTPWKTLFRKQ